MANVRFAVGITRFIPFFGYHHILMILIAIAIILLSLLLAGNSSSSPGIPGIYLITFYYPLNGSYPIYNPAIVNAGVYAQAPTTAWGNPTIPQIVGSTCLEVRVGYFGLCVNADGFSFVCSNNATLLRELLEPAQDPLNLLFVASTFKNNIVFPYLLIAALVLAFITFLLLATFPGWHEERDARTGSDVDVKPFPSRPVTQIALALIFISSVFVLITVLWQHVAAVSASQITQDFANGSVASGVGVTAMVLGWFGFALLAIVTVGLVVMVLSIHLLDRLTDD